MAVATLPTYNLLVVELTVVEISQPAIEGRDLL